MTSRRVPAALHRELTEYASLMRALKTQATMDITSHLSQPGLSGVGGYAGQREEGGLILAEEIGLADALEPLEIDVDQTQLDPLPANVIAVYDPDTGAEADTSSDEYQLLDDSDSDSGLSEPGPGSKRTGECKLEGGEEKKKKVKKSRSSRDLWTRWPLPPSSISLPEWTLNDEVGVIVAQVLRSLPAFSVPRLHSCSDSGQVDDEEEEGSEGQVAEGEEESDEKNGEEDENEEEGEGEEEGDADEEVEANVDEVAWSQLNDAGKTLQRSLQQLRAESPTSSIGSTTREVPPFLAPITKEVVSFLAHLFALIAAHSPARAASMQNRIEPIGWEGISELLVGSGEGSSWSGPGGVYANGKADGWTVNEEVARRTLERLQAIYGPSEVQRKVLARLDAKARAKGQFKRFLDEQEDRWLFEPLVMRSSPSEGEVYEEREEPRHSELEECESTLVHSNGETDELAKPQEGKPKRKRISQSQGPASPQIDDCNEDFEQPQKKRRTTSGRVASNAITILPRVEVIEDESDEDDEMDELADDEDQYVPTREMQGTGMSSDDEAEVDHFVRTRRSVSGYSDDGG